MTTAQRYGMLTAIEILTRRKTVPTQTIKRMVMPADKVAELMEHCKEYGLSLETGDNTQAGVHSVRIFKGNSCIGGPFNTTPAAYHFLNGFREGKNIGRPRRTVHLRNTGAMTWAFLDTGDGHVARIDIPQNPAMGNVGELITALRARYGNELYLKFQDAPVV